MNANKFLNCYFIFPLITGKENYLIPFQKSRGNKCTLIKTMKKKIE